MARVRPETTSPSGTEAAGASSRISSSVSSGESQSPHAPATSNLTRQLSLCTGMQGRTSAKADLLAARESSERLPTATGLCGCTKESRRAWSCSRQISSSHAMPSCGHAPVARASAEAYIRVAPAATAACAASGVVTSAQIATGDAFSLLSTIPLWPKVSFRSSLRACAQLKARLSRLGTAAR